MSSQAMDGMLRKKRTSIAIAMHILVHMCAKLLA